MVVQYGQVRKSMLAAEAVLETFGQTLQCKNHQSLAALRIVDMHPACVQISGDHLGLAPRDLQGSSRAPDKKLL